MNLLLQVGNITTLQHLMQESWLLLIRSHSIWIKPFFFVWVNSVLFHYFQFNMCRDVMAKEFKLVSLIQIAMYILSKRLGMLGPHGGAFVHLKINVKQDVILSTTFSHARLVNIGMLLHFVKRLWFLLIPMNKAIF